MNAFIIILIIVVIIALVSKKKIQEMKDLYSEGKITARKGRFYEDVTWFFTNETFENVLKATMSIDLSEAEVQCEPITEKQCISFVHGGSWEASLKRCENDNGEQYFKFSFNSWKTRDGVPYGTNNMNMLLTAIEKMFKELDPNTEFEVHKQKINTKTNWI